MDVATWFENSVHWLVEMVDQLGILGIFIMTFLESTFVPIPSEITMIPAGYLVHEGQMDLVSVLLASTIGTISGAYFNYWIARRFGRGMFLRYGKYFFMKPEKLVKLESFFMRHGPISMFIGRLIPGVRHYIAFPAGLAKMDRRKFLLYTALGAALWMSVLMTLGYHIGKNRELALTYMPLIKLGIIGFVAVVTLLYSLYQAKRLKRTAPTPNGK